MSEDVYAAWRRTIDEIAEVGGTVLLLGPTDSGKSTFAKLLTNRTVESGAIAGIVDADVGQSEIGPPACVGAGLVSKPIHALSEAERRGLFFVGSTSPLGYLLPYAVAVRSACDLLSDAGTHVTIIDCCGYVQGSGALALNSALFDLVRPAHVVALQRTGELEATLAPIRRRTGCRIYTPPIPGVIGRKPAGLRTQRRALRFAAYFEGAAQTAVNLNDVAIPGAWLGAGTPLPAHLTTFVRRTLAPIGRVYYAERLGNALALMVDRPIAREFPGVGVVLQQLKLSTLVATIAPKLKSLLLGLEDENGRMLGLGIATALDFRRGSLGVLTPVRDAASIRLVRLGGLRLRPDGAEIGTIRPGELEG